jgi:DHA1 family tetracycline resistance protein-like MFS transporter
MRRWSLSPLAVIFLIVFLDLVGMGILVPVFPFLVRQFRSDALTVGLMSFAFSAAQFGASPMLGVLSDRYGRRPVLLISLLGTAFGYFLFGWAGSLWVMYVARIIDGATGGNISTAQAYIADVSAPADRAKNFGLIGAAFGLGFIVGPALGGLLARISLTAPAYASGIFSLFTFAAAYWFLPESLPPERRLTGSIPWRRLEPVGQILQAIRRPRLGRILAVWFLMTLAMSGLQSNFAVYTADRFALGPGANSAIFAAIGTVGAVTQGFLIRRLATRFSGRALVTAGLVIAAAGFTGITLAPAPWFLFPSCMTIAFGIGLASPSITGLLSQEVSNEEQGAVLGVAQSLASFTRGVGPVWAGAIYDRAGMTSPYWTGAIWLVLGCAPFTRSSSGASTPSSRAAPSTR